MAFMTRSAGETLDDLGERLLAVHPRGEQWLQLDVTVVNLDFDRLERIGELVDAGTGRVQLREQLVAGIADSELRGRLSSRWVRWLSIFSLPQPDDLTVPPASILRHPNRLVASDAVPPAYLSGVLGLFDAALAILAVADGMSTLSVHSRHRVRPIHPTGPRGAP